jgi:hypothetical protein
MAARIFSWHTSITLILMAAPDESVSFPHRSNHPWNYLGATRACHLYS